jgi:glycosyltransferase involved in cell wall biosynthesis
MRVLAFSSIYPSSRDPIRGIYNNRCLISLSRDWEVRAVAPIYWWSRLRRPKEFLSTPHEALGGVETTYPNFWYAPKLNRTHARSMYASTLSHVRRIRKEFPFDAVLGFFAYPDGAAAAHLADAFDCPLVINILGSDINVVPETSPAMRRQVQRGLERAQRIIVLSEPMRQRVCDLGIDPHRVIVQHNGVDRDRFFIQDREAACDRLGITPHKKRICYVGNLQRIKGVDVLIQSIPSLVRAGMENFELAIVGGGATRESLEAQVRQLGVQDKVTFYGKCIHSEVAAWIGASDALCLPSRNEGCPNVILEALACGRPVVASAVGGVPELMNENNGVMAPSEDPEALADGLFRVLNRSWDPKSLERSIQLQTWDDFGAAFKSALAASAEEWANRGVSAQRAMA